MMGLVWVNTNKFSTSLVKMTLSDKMLVVQIHSHITVSNSFYKGNFGNKAKEPDVQKYMVSAVKHDKNF
jgi:hypothetical protein